MFLSQKFLYMAIIAVALIVICLQLVSIQLNTDAAKQQVLDMFKSPFATIASRVGPPKPTVIGAHENINVTKKEKDKVEEPPPKVDVPHYHENLHPPNLQLINITDFNIIINTDICNVTDIAIVTIIHSAGHNRVCLV